MQVERLSMPIYEYKATSPSSCDLCKAKFEILQSLNDRPLTKCPKCKAPVKRLFSVNFIATTEPLSFEETFNTHTSEEADNLGLDGGFAGDQVWE